jgi:flagellar basal-body rod modification protein FlgD
MNSIPSGSDIYADLGLANDQQQVKNDQLKLDDFMNLMVTELTHQDPFKPMENTDLATQISQFATVSGIDNLNSSFNDLSSTLTSDQALQATSLVGHDVMVNTDLGWFTGEENLRGNVELPSTASNVTVRISDARGSLVREIELGGHEAGSLAFNWDGLNDAGEYMPAGLYQVTAQANVDDVEMAPNVMISAQVESVSLGGSNGVQLNLAGLGRISMNDVAEIQ